MTKGFHAYDAALRMVAAVARAWGHIEAASVAEADRGLDRVLAMLWRLTHGPRR